jgi:hypothetical protein
MDNALIESFWSTMQRGLPDLQQWGSRVELASATVEWIEDFYNPAAVTPPQEWRPRASSRTCKTPRPPGHDHLTETVRETGSGS